MQVLNEANFTNAVLVRSVLTRSDLGGAIIEGADFSDAVIDLPQKQVILLAASDVTSLGEICVLIGVCPLPWLTYFPFFNGQRFSVRF